MTSIRIFLVVLLMAVVTLGNFMAALRGYRQSLDEAQRVFDEQLEHHLSLLDYALTQNGSVKPLPETINPRMAFQITTTNQEVLAHSSNVPAQTILTAQAGFSTHNIGGHRWHLLTRPSSRNGVWLTVGERDDLRFRVAEGMALQAIYPMLLILPITGLIIWFVVGLGLRPIARLTSQLSQREATDLAPIDTDDMPRELEALTHATNALLARLEASFEREKRFSADTAHELRTPIAAMQMHLENLIDDWYNRGQCADTTLDYLSRSVKRMHYLIEQILTLNRTAPDLYTARFEPVELQALVREVVALNSPAIAQKRHNVSVVGRATTVHGDGPALQTLVSNLLGNAIKYTPADGHITINVNNVNDRAILEVSDSGPGIASEQRIRIFDRFYRLGGDRHSSQTEGVGLGLSIVKQIAELHHATIQLHDSHFDTGLTVQVTLPINARCEHRGVTT
ncbi:ATP-binding protein [uncultured Gilvimarinus sp.]|uniref:ATP-binding protein n=1 Tax=uncultured Gilvimarinus sp. TaxID=1689143 RepID=UPI0030D9F18A